MKLKQSVFVATLGIVAAVLIAGDLVSLWGSTFKPLFSIRIELNRRSWSVADLAFEHVIIDDDPLAAQKITDIEIVDIDGDGKLDVWVPGEGNPSDYQMAWYKAPDWQRFPIARGDYGSGGWGDIDGDGDMDLAVNHSGHFVWFENIGNLEQPDWSEHEVTGQFTSDTTKFADFNADGYLDMICLTFGSEVYYLPGPVDLESGGWTLYKLGQSSARRAGGTLADIDRDGDLDVLWGNGWLENPGNPTQTPWTDRTIDSDWPKEAQGIVADLDGDGRPDVVLSGEESGAGVAWYRAPVNPKTGIWTKNVVVSSGYQGVHSLQLADFDADGDLDVFAAEMHQGNDPDKVAIFENVDISSNTWTEHIIATTGSHKAKVGDLDGDGDLDIVGKNWNNDQYPLRVEMWKNNVTPKLSLDDWQRHIIDPDKPWRTVSINSADMDGDGQKDIITGGWWYKSPNSLDGTWVRHTIGSPLNNMAAVHDFDDDGDMDVLGTQGQGSDANADFAWARNDGSGVCTILTNVPSGDGDFLQGVAVDRFQGSNIEVALAWHSTNSIQVLTVPSNPSGGMWDLRTIYTSGDKTKGIASGDIDRDGDIDLIVGDMDESTPGLEWLRNDTGSWTPFTLANVGPGAHRIRLIDINGDSRLDAVVGFYVDRPGYLAWYEQGGSATSLWTEHIIANASEIYGPMSLDVADMDGDGDVDVVVGEHNTSDPSSARLFVYENADGQGAGWTPHLVYTGDEHHQGAQVVDIDDDGDLDIISIGWSHNRVLLYENEALASVDLEPRMWLPVILRSAVTAPPSRPRVIDGLQVLYIFDEGSGTMVNDVSGVGEPLDLTVSDLAAVRWISGALAIDTPAVISSAGAATKVIDAARTNNELTIEAWVSPANTTQGGPARIVALSVDPHPHGANFMLGQEATSYDVRLRTTETDQYGRPSLTTPSGTLSSALTHVVYTRDVSGTTCLYLDGVLLASGSVGGDFSAWSDSYVLALGNEPTGDRPWLGEFHLVAIFDRALSQAEVDQNFHIGPGTISPIWSRIWLPVVLKEFSCSGVIVAYRHTSFWQCMDTLRKKYILESLWQSGRAPWRPWR